MLSTAVLFQHSLWYGMLLSILMSSVIFATLYLCPQIWVSDAPEDIQRAIGPISAHDLRLKQLIGIPTMLAVLAILVAAIIQLNSMTKGALTFWDVAISTFLIIQVFNLVDLVIIDWLVVVTLRPAFLVVPGTEDLQGYRAYRFHFIAFLKGVVGSLMMSALIAGITLLLKAFLAI